MSGRPPLVAELRWAGGSRLAGASGGASVLLDWEGTEGPSPVQALAFALAGCMASDVILILQKGRVAPAALRIRVTADRADSDPRRFVRVALHFEVEGAVPVDRLERALALSRETYCSVWHSLRSDIDLRTSYEVVAPQT